MQARPQFNVPDIQGDVEASMKPLSELKTLLKDVAASMADSGGSKQLPLCTTSYQMSCNSSSGLIWNEMTEEQALHHSSYLQASEIDGLHAELFTQVCY